MIQFPFQDYKTVAFSKDTSGTGAAIYTTEYKSMIYVEVTNSIEWDGAFERITIYAEPANMVDNPVNLWKFGNVSLADADSFGVSTAILPDSTPIYAFRNDEAVSGVIHVFRLPEL